MFIKKKIELAFIFAAFIGSLSAGHANSYLVASDLLNQMAQEEYSDENVIAKQSPLYLEKSSVSEKVAEEKLVVKSTDAQQAKVLEEAKNASQSWFSRVVTRVLAFFGYSRS